MTRTGRHDTDATARAVRAARGRAGAGGLGWLRAAGAGPGGRGRPRAWGARSRAWGARPGLALWRVTVLRALAAAALLGAAACGALSDGERSPGGGASTGDAPGMSGPAAGGAGDSTDGASGASGPAAGEPDASGPAAGTPGAGGPAGGASGASGPSAGGPGAGEPGGVEPGAGASRSALRLCVTPPRALTCDGATPDGSGFGIEDGCVEPPPGRLGLALGIVRVGETSDVGRVRVFNDGDERIALERVQVVDEAPCAAVGGACGRFEVGPDKGPFTLAPGGEVALAVRFVAGTASGARRAELVFTSTEKAHPSRVVPVEAHVNAPPVARLSGCPDGTRPPLTAEQLLLDGSASSDPEGAALTFRWAASWRGFDATLRDLTTDLRDPRLAPGGASAALGLDAPGRFEVTLEVGDGCAAAPGVGVATCDFTARAPVSVGVALTWESPDVELDLHTWPDTSRFLGERDCWAEGCGPEVAPEAAVRWCDDDGAGPPTRDVVLEGADEPLRPGAERMTLTRACADVVWVAVHRRDDRRAGDGRSEATVRVSCGGPIAELARELEAPGRLWVVGALDVARCEFLENGQVSWPGTP